MDISLAYSRVKKNRSRERDQHLAKKRKKKKEVNRKNYKKKKSKRNVQKDKSLPTKEVSGSGSLDEVPVADMLDVEKASKLNEPDPDIVMDMSSNPSKLPTKEVCGASSGDEVPDADMLDVKKVAEQNERDPYIVMDMSSTPSALPKKEVCGAGSGSGDEVPDADMLDVEKAEHNERDPDNAMGKSSTSTPSGEEISNGSNSASSEDRREMITWHSSYTKCKCSNCHRTNLSSDTTYSFPTYEIYSHKVKKVNIPLRYVPSHKSVEDARRLRLCNCCYRFLNVDPSYDKDRFKWKNIWPSFMWDLLVGKDKSTGIPFRVSYKPEHLWKFIPSSCRRYWLKSLKKYKEYKFCSIDQPTSFFVDRTLELQDYVDF